MKFILTFLFIIVFSQLSFVNQAIGKLVSTKKPYPDTSNSITCNLTHITSSHYSPDNKKIKISAKKEKSKYPTIFTDLKSKTPKMLPENNLLPNKIDLMKLNENNGTYWLLSGGTSATVVFLIDTKQKTFVQSRIMNLEGHTVATNWMGKCL